MKSTSTSIILADTGWKFQNTAEKGSINRTSTLYHESSLIVKIDQNFQHNSNEAHEEKQSFVQKERKQAE